MAIIFPVKVTPKKEHKAMRPGKTKKDKEGGAWSNRFANQQARADEQKNGDKKIRASISKIIG